MVSRTSKDPIRWRLHLQSPAVSVYRMLSTDEGRAKFWAEEAPERDGVIHFTFPGGFTWEGEVVRAEEPRLFSVRYIGGSTVTFVLEEDGNGGTDLTLTDEGVADDDRSEVIAGWVSVLMSLKAAIDFGVDLRAHDPGRHWGNGFVEN
jgi:uncharacterized protein YndB with AHSA1/START domain